MVKRVLAFLFIAFFIVSILTVAVVTAADSSSSTGAGELFGESKSWGITAWFKEKWDLWLKGGDLTATGNLLKYLALGLVILLIYSALSFVKFPQNSDGESMTFVQIIISVIVGFMVTFFITNQELFTIMQSYKAAGIALTVFFPIMILAFFTLVVASKASPMGIFLQKVIWIIYSVWLFIRTAALAIATQYVKVVDVGGNKTVELLNNADKLPTFLQPFFPSTKTELAQMLSQNDATMVVVLLIVSIAVFFIMVVSNKPVIAWLAKEKMDSEIAGAKSTISRSAAYDKMRAQQMEKG